TNWHHSVSAWRDHGPPSSERLLAAYSNSATVTGGAPRHTSSMTAGGTRQPTNHSSPAPMVIGAPTMTLHANTTATPANHVPTNRAREILFNMVSLCLISCPA